VACFGAENILFGTDNPIYRSEWQLDSVRDANILDEERQAILHDNGARALRRWQ
jgi:predicted TIM-barrel fold metal-dependent hydrolase